MAMSPVVSPDFDFQIGTWRVSHRRQKERLANCTEWESFDGTCTMFPVLGGNGNIEDNLLNIASGAYRALAVRSYNPEQQTCTIWWLDARSPHSLDVPVVGRFENGIGAFYAIDSLNSIPVRVRFLWLCTDAPTPRWEQAMSADNGVTWETNWTMDFARN
jgi:hypothetical protein